MPHRRHVAEQNRLLADILSSNGIPGQVALEALDPLALEQGWRRLLAYTAKIGQHTGPELLRMLTQAQRYALFPANADAESFVIAGCPPLPKEARLDLAIGQGAGVWIAAYTRHAHAVSPMTPRLFHQSAALWLASVTIARRLKVSVGFGPLYPNLFIQWLAATTLFRKSTALTIARRVARAIMGHLLLPQDSTPEALLSILAGHNPGNLDDLPHLEQDEIKSARNFAAQKGLLLDESSGLLASAGRDYNAGLLEAFMRFADCDPLYRRRTLSRGQVTVRHSYLSFLGATTPQAMSTHLKEGGLWHKGWWPRFVILTPETAQPEWCRPIDVDALDTHPLTSLYERLPTTQWPEPPVALSLQIEGEALEVWHAYNKALSHTLLTPDLEQRLFGSYGRLPAFALKVATILAALNWSQGKPMIDMPHMVWALGFTERCRASLHRTCKTVASVDADALEQRILRRIARYEPVGATMRDLYRALNMKAHDLEPTLDDLETIGLVTKVEQQLPGRGSRSTMRYHLVSE